MGDRFSSPNFTHMAEALSALVRGCHTRASISISHSFSATGAVPPTSLPDTHLQLLPNEDILALYHPVLYMKSLKEGIHQKSITEIILHLSWEDGGLFSPIIYNSFYLQYLNRLQPQDY